MGKMSEMRLRVTSRPSLPTLIAESSVSSTPRSAQNRNSAITTLSMVRMVRRLLRNRFTTTSENRFMASPRRSVGQHALVEVQHPAGALGGVRIVGDHDDGLLELAIEPLEQLEDLFPRLAVEVAGRLVGQQQRRIAHDGARDRHPLLLPAGELAWVVPEPLPEADDAERVLGAFDPLLAAHLDQQQRQLDVLERGQHRDQVIELEDVADVARAPAGEI